MKVYFVLVFQLLTIGSGNCNTCQTYGYYNITQFGDNCQYRCRCINEEQCERDTGTCQNGCAPGWMGPGCQYRNLASLSIGSTQNTDTGTLASIALDNNSTTCSNSLTSEDHETWWRVDLPKPYNIIGLVIKFNTASVLTFRVEGSSDGFSTLEQCYLHRHLVVTKEIEIMCLERMYVQHVRIMLPATSQMLQLCEVELYGGRYISYKGTTSTSTIFWGPSGNAVDGRPMLSGDNQELDAARTCVMTHQLINQHWTIDFSKYMLIQGIYVYGRRLPLNPEYYAQSAMFLIHALPLNGSYSQIYSDNPSGNSWEDYQPRMVDLLSPRKSSGVFILHNRLDHLALCEVEIFAECEDGLCGWNCSDVCHCAAVTTGSFRKDGICPHGCSHRWTGQNGRCDSTCPNNTWGPNCALVCRCAPGTQCNIDNGTCPEECDIGWKEPTCNTSCDNNMYGQNCNARCGHCLNTVQCNAFTGNCIGGCEPGWQGSLCQNQCDDYYYGYDCNKTCNNCFASEPCDNEDGNCLSCKTGYKGDDCNTACDNNMYGQNCSESCGHCQGNEQCNAFTGHCPGECETGWEGNLCQKPCDDHTYGLRCTSICGHCFQGGVCIKSSGVCPNGCMSGYKGVACNDSCDAKTYGLDCQETCGHCKDDEDPCDTVIGHCPGGCMPGWKGRLCKETCANLFYGLNCNRSCGSCMDGSTCHYQTGVCESGCVDGKMPPLCQEECAPYTYGQNCLGRCGVCKDNQPCHLSTGECIHGCEPGYSGEICRQHLSEETDNTPEGAIIIGLAAVIVCLFVALVVIVVTLVCYIRRLRERRTKQNTEDIDSRPHTNSSTTETSFYEQLKPPEYPAADLYTQVNINSGQESDNRIYVNENF